MFESTLHEITLKGIVGRWERFDMFTIFTSFLRSAVEKRNWLYWKVYIPPAGSHFRRRIQSFRDEARPLPWEMDSVYNYWSTVTMYSITIRSSNSTSMLNAQCSQCSPKACYSDTESNPCDSFGRGRTWSTLRTCIPNRNPNRNPNGTALLRIGGIRPNEYICNNLNESLSWRVLAL